MDAKAAARPAGGLELAAQRADTLLHPEDSVAGAFRGTAGVRPVPSVVDRHEQAALPVLDGDASRGGRGMVKHVRQRFLLRAAFRLDLLSLPRRVLAPPAAARDRPLNRSSRRREGLCAAAAVAAEGGNVAMGTGDALA